jgi:hypothetical protein
MSKTTKKINLFGDIKNPKGREVLQNQNMGAMGSSRKEIGIFRVCFTPRQMPMI